VIERVDIKAFSGRKGHRLKAFLLEFYIEVRSGVLAVKQSSS
jgi:hypothetical protein